jgi:molybdate transport system substrate-binding protein
MNVPPPSGVSAKNCRIARPPQAPFGHAPGGDDSMSRRHYDAAKLGRMTMNNSFAMSAALAVLLAAVGSVGPSAAAEIKVLSTVALKAALDEDLLPQLARSAETKVTIKYDAAAALKKEIDNGESFDVAILVPAGIDDLIKEGKIEAASRTNLARVGVGVAVRAGAPKPDISTAEAFKRTLLNAKSIAYGDPALGGASSVYFANLLQRLGIADEVKAKTKLTPSGEGAKAVADGAAEIGVGQISEIVPVRGAELAGPFPAEYQVYTAFVAGVSANAKDAAAAASFLKFLTTPAALQIFKARGLDPT